MNENLKLRAWSNSSVYNCNNCSLREQCNAIRIGIGTKERALRNYFCWEHPKLNE